MKIKFIIPLIILIFILSSCAKRGTPDGGKKDESPPEVLKTLPENNSVLFNDNRVRIFFDEYIKLEDLNSQLVVSPPIEKNKYSIFPQGGASKYIDIEINETFADSTTYVFNFGQSIIDNNEGNELPFYKYAFSTGPYIDSLEFDGMINDSYSSKTEKLITAMLYPLNKEFNDSLVFNKKPTYVASTLDSTYFKFTNLKSGKYHLVAIKDYNNNFLFDPLLDKIAFYDTIIDIPGKYDVNLKIFKEVPSFFIFKPYQDFYNRISFGYRGEKDSLKIRIENRNANESTAITYENDKDTLNFWFKEFEYDTLLIKVENKSYEKKFKLAYPKKVIDKDSLQIQSENNNSIDLGSKFILDSNIPINSVNDEYIKILNKDSIEVSFSTKIENKNRIVFDFEVLPNDKYSINLLPNSLIDFYENTIDTLQYNLSTKKSSDYGTLILNITSLKKYPIIVQLLDTNEKIIKTQYMKDVLSDCVFENVNPGDYNVRLIHDENKNMKWDPGNYLKKVNPEETAHSIEKIKVRANWIIRETI